MGFHSFFPFIYYSSILFFPFRSNISFLFSVEISFKDFPEFTLRLSCDIPLKYPSQAGVCNFQQYAPLIRKGKSVLNSIIKEIKEIILKDYISIETIGSECLYGIIIFIIDHIEDNKSELKERLEIEEKEKEKEKEKGEKEEEEEGETMAAMKRVFIRFHHIKSSTKRRLIQKFAKDHDITGISRPGINLLINTKNTFIFIYLFIFIYF